MKHATGLVSLKVALVYCLCFLWNLDAASANVQDNLQPTRFWKHFAELSKFPKIDWQNCSDSSGHSADYVRRAAEHHGLKVVPDAVGNIVVRKPATGGKDSQVGEPVIIHARLADPCAKPGAAPGDFAQPSLTEDGWILSDKAHLDTRDITGMALALAMMEEPAEDRFPQLEFLFTSVPGVQGLQSDILDGQRMINLNAEEHGVFVVGSSGSRRVKLNLPVAEAKLAPGSRSFVLSARGFSGGHSGLDMHLGGGNAVTALARAVSRIRQKVSDVQLVSFLGGGYHGEIPKEAHAAIGVNLSNVPITREVVAEVERDLRAEFAVTDPDLQLRLEQPEKAANVAFSEESTERLLDLLVLVPSGVQRHNVQFPGSLETSVNIARVRKASEGMLEVSCLVRSCVPTTAETLSERIERLARRVVASPYWGVAEPAWAPNWSSVFLAAAQEAFHRVEGRSPKLAVAHDDLQVARIKAIWPDLDLVVVGTDLTYDSGKGWRLKVDAISKTWAFLRFFLGEIAGAKANSNFGSSEL